VIVDSHHHFWDPALGEYPWMTDDVAPIRRRFGPEHLEPLLREHGVAGTVVVQARGSLDETRELLEIADATPFVLGVVGWVDFAGSDVADLLGGLGGKLVGVRHQVHDEADPRWLLRPDVQRGLTAVGEAGLAYDLLIRTRELPAALETARLQPRVRFVVDHLAKPPLRDGATGEWARGLAALAELPNVTCKLSGLVTEAHWTAWRRNELVPYLRSALDWFGHERCMFGSDWPVCLLAADYGTVLSLVVEAAREDERAAVLGGTAARVYRLRLRGRTQEIGLR
jgi:L-fucono-1,5-lactonase